MPGVYSKTAGADWLVAPQVPRRGRPGHYGTFDNKQEALRVLDLVLELIQAFENPEGRVPVEGSECDAMLEKHKTLKDFRRAMQVGSLPMTLATPSSTCGDPSLCISIALMSLNCFVSRHYSYSKQLG